MSTSSERWKLPSPTWPTIGAMRRHAAMSSCVATTHSARREIGTQTSLAIALAPGRSAQRGPVGVVARLPQARAVLGPGRPLERAAAAFGGDGAEALGLLGDAGLAAVELDAQHRALRQRELGIGIHRLDLQGVEQFDAGDRYPALDGGDGRLARRLDRGKRTDAAGHRFRNAEQLEGDLGDDAERSFRAHQQPRQIVARRRLARPARSRDAPRRCRARL